MNNLTAYSLRITAIACAITFVMVTTACNHNHSLPCDGPAGDLHEALAAKDSAKALEVASSKKIEVNATCPAHSTLALITAASLGYTAVVVQVLEQGAAIDEPENKYGRTALMWAAYNGYLSVVQHLLQLGAAIDKPDSSGYTALAVAATNGHLPVVQLLLEEGAAIDKQDNYGWTALMRAVQYGHLSVVQHLLQRGADIEKQDNNYGHTALMRAIERIRAPDNILLLKALIDTPQNFHLTNNGSRTALEMAEWRFKEAAPADEKFYRLVIAMLKKKMRP